MNVNNFYDESFSIFSASILRKCMSADVLQTAFAALRSSCNADSSSNTAKADCKNMAKAAFGAAHLLSHREYLKNAVTDGYESAGAWYDSDVEMMTEEMVYGGKELKNVTAGTHIPSNYTIDHSQLPLFALDRSKICNRAAWWLRDVVSATNFANVNNNGNCNNNNASNANIGVRPDFVMGPDVVAYMQKEWLSLGKP